MESSKSRGQQEEENNPWLSTEKSAVACDADTQSLPPHKLRKAIPLKRVLLFFVVIFVILIALIINASFHNTSKYYLEVAAGAVEIWKGTFSPAGKKRLLIMPGVMPPETRQSVYTRRQINPLIFRYYVDKADMLMNLPGMPDFVGIKSYLNRSLIYATDAEQQQIVIARLNAVDRTILLYKADVVASKGSQAGLTAAKKYLKEAAELDPDEIQANLIKQKLVSIQKIIETIDPTESKASKPLPPYESVVNPNSGK